MDIKNNQQLENRSKLQSLIRSLLVKFKLVLCVLFSNSKLWYVGQYKEQKSTHEIQGIFSTEAKAKKACRDRTYFIHPLVLDVNLPHESNKWQGSYPIEE